MNTILILLTSFLLNNHWTFALGDAASMEKDFTHGTEYFSWFSKAATTGSSRSPIMPDFDDSAWQEVSLPHDWVVDLPYSAQASHSHGYKCVGWRWPGSSVGWYRRHLSIPAEDKGKQIWIEFEGIFRDSEVYCNGFYLGHEKSGYVSQIYDLSPYLEYGGDNVITVRCNASLEEGWFYEGAGIYRNVRLHKAGPVAMKPWSLVIEDGRPRFETVLASEDLDPAKVSTRWRILDAEGREVIHPEHRWSPGNPYLYTMEIRLYYDGRLSAEYSRRFGMRDIVFDPERGLLIDGMSCKLKGCNLHLDHAGVGVGVPDELWRYRLEQLKRYGFNAVRCSHNPATPAMLDLCDELGMLVIDENRPLGVNEEQLGQLRQLIGRDRNHPCVILWSIGNEEWAVENNEKGYRIAQRMTEEVHRLDPSRPATYANAGGREIVKGVDVFGYNYIIQNPIEEYHAKYPDHPVVGTEETTGSGTRGRYATVPEEGWMKPINRVDTAGRLNVIEHGWKFYKERPWAAGIFYWTGQDYRGEPNPMAWPATGSQFGILDYCCFPKDEAFYLQSAWTDVPMVHICGPCDGEVWVYSNCSSVILYADGRRLGRQEMPRDGHLAWKAGNAQRFSAKGFRDGKTVATDQWPERLTETSVSASKTALKADGQDLAVLDIRSAEESLDVCVENACFLGWGNGNPGFKETERPADGKKLRIRPFAGRAQVLVRSIEGSHGQVRVLIGDRTVTLDLLPESL